MKIGLRLWTLVECHSVVDGGQLCFTDEFRPNEWLSRLIPKGFSSELHKMRTLCIALLSLSSNIEDMNIVKVKLLLRLPIQDNAHCLDNMDPSDPNFLTVLLLSVTNAFVEQQEEMTKKTSMMRSGS
ncbi:hypothetical protein PV328_000731 [Microctonus aethiopoides]|uniref:Uncharacterized protein n=1 Tax=Microctonus aethiopoides TaxID=144406 RepID=A0AA39FVQ4_9HYME|nr:hypothetical protein PV328_000731 [Microctonus aethiopoides]